MAILRVALLTVASVSTPALSLQWVFDADEDVSSPPQDAGHETGDKPSILNETGGKPSFLYMLGAEGSNHHGTMLELVQPLLTERCKRGPCPSQHTLDSEQRCPSIQSAGDPVFARALSDLDETALPVMLNASPGAWFVENRSFPCGLKHRQVPEPFNVTNLFSIVSPLTKFKFLVLQRSFQHMVQSHAWFDHGLEAHAAKMAEYLSYLSSELAGIPRSYWKVLPVDCLEQDEPTRMLAKERVAEFLGLRGQCCGCFNAWANSHPHPYDGQIDQIEKSTISGWPVFDPSEDGPYLSQYLLDPNTCQ